MRYFDFHTHAFADAVAGKAMAGLSDTSGFKPVTDGTLGDLRRIMAERSIDSFMVLPIATKPKQQTVINNWAAEIMGGGVYCCGSVHPDAEDKLEETERIHSLGLYGIKFHPEYQFFSPDDEKMFPLYEKMSELGLIAVFHGGWDPYDTDKVYARPETFAAVAERFPNLKIVAAHMGGMKMFDEAEKYIVGKFRNIWLDTAVVSMYMDDALLLRMIKNHGADRVLFGSDCPWDEPMNEIKMIERIDLSEAEKEMILFRNAEELLGTVRK